MNKYIIPSGILVLFLFCFSCSPKNEKDYNKLTAINPLAYTSVVYSSVIDTVYVSTYSGRIAQRINNDRNEKIIINIDDEIYALAYVKTQGVIAAATQNSGIVLISAKTRNIIKKLSLNHSWGITLSVTNNQKYLFTSDINGINHIWDIEQNYEEITLPETISKKSLRGADSSNKFYFSSGGTASVWNIEKDEIEDELAIGYNKLVDIDNEGNILLLNHNEAYYFDILSDTLKFKVSHPSWIYFDQRDKMLGEIPLSMKLTQARLARNKFFTAGIDRSIRVWNSENGELLDSFTGHTATISGLDLNPKQTQLVSVDLKGNIKFWNTSASK